MKVFWCQIECLVSFSICYKTFFSSIQTRKLEQIRHSPHDRCRRELLVATVVNGLSCQASVRCSSCPVRIFWGCRSTATDNLKSFLTFFSFVFVITLNSLSISEAFEYTKLFILARVGLGWLNCYALITLIAHSHSDPGTGSKKIKTTKILYYFSFHRYLTEMKSQNGRI